MARNTDAAPTEDHSGDDHAVENADAQTDQTPAAEDVEPSEDEQEARDNTDAARAERTAPTTVTPELAQGVDPITGGEKSVEDARRDGVPVMVPESRGDIRTDVTFPKHIQAPPVEQVAPGTLSKASSSTSQRVAAARRERNG